MNEEGQTGSAGAATPETGATCPWCSAPVPTGEAHCPSCGAAVAQREGLDALEISGVTSVDPWLQGDHSVLQGVMRVQQASNAAAARGAHLPHFGPPGAELLLGGLAFGSEIAGGLRMAGDLLTAGTAEVDTSRIGEPSELALLAAARLDDVDRAAGTAPRGEEQGLVEPDSEPETIGGEETGEPQ